MKLKSDFFTDWVNILKDILTNHWGYDISNVPEEELPFVYFNAEKRRPDLRKRNIKLSDCFVCPENLKSGWEKLKSTIVNGEDITPNLSKLVNKLNNVNYHSHP